MSPVDTFERARKVADAVLYEGYVLYPYRASSRKNQVRWQFGVVAPRAFAEADGFEDWVSQTECLVEAGVNATLDVRVRFLRVQQRQVEQAVGDERFEPVASLDVDGTLLTSWDEAVEEEVNVRGADLAALLTAERKVQIELGGSEEAEDVRDASGRLVGRVLRRREALLGIVRLAAEVVPGPHPLVKVRVRIENETPWSRRAGTTRDDMARRSFAAVHTLMAVTGGAFLSLADPPEFAAPAAQACTNLHTWPVLVGDLGQRDVVLSSPVILCDHPEVAPESPGDMFDATEIDEILALRVMTLTEEEKREARSTDPRAAAVIDRCDVMPEEIFERLHGAVRYLRDVVPQMSSAASPPRLGPQPQAPPERGGPYPTPGRDAVERVPFWTPEAEAEVNPFGDTVWVGPVEVGRGMRVRLRPGRRADAHDLFLAGRDAVVQAVFHDVDGNVQVAVSVLDDDGAEYQIGHGRYLFFYPEEVEPLEVQAR